MTIIIIGQWICEGVGILPIFGYARPGCAENLSAGDILIHNCDS